MSKPNLIVIAGCNGSGKSTYSNSLLSGYIQVFDADKKRKEIYDAFTFDFELRAEMAWNKTQEEFKTLVKKAISENLDFAYETNFNLKPMFWISRFKNADFNIKLIYFCLEDIELAKERVAIRFENGGHYVTDNEVELRYYAGFSNLNKFFMEFDEIYLLDASAHNKIPSTLLHYEKNYTPNMIRDIPNYLYELCPDFINYLIKSSHDHHK
jgi:predicted ABC-type ATPase